MRNVIATLWLTGLLALGTIGAVVGEGPSADSSSKADSAAGLGDKPPDAVVAPKTLHCLMAVVVSGFVTRSELWASADGDRTEMLAIGDQNLEPHIVSIQKGGMLYTFSKASKAGERARLPAGLLASLGILEQIETVRRKGQIVGSFEADSSLQEAGAQGGTYDVYRYVAAEETVEAWIHRATATPFRWASKATKVDSQSLSVFAKVEPNVPIPDSLLKLPQGITWKETALFK